MTILLTGAAGFIGAYTARALLEAGQAVVGLDNFNDYYDPQIKRDRVAALCPALDLRTLDLTDNEGLAALFDEVKPTAVIHLAAQAGVRYSLENPQAYVDSNLVGFVNMLELCRHRGVQHLVYASSSSVYGDSATPPFSEDQRVDQPRSLYAATKAANELMAYTYAQLYGLHATGLRFFTVYGPWGRPDMAPLLSRGRCWPVGRSTCSTKAVCSAISHMSPTLCPVSSAPSRIRPTARCRTGCSTSATIRRSSWSASSA